MFNACLLLLALSSAAPDALSVTVLDPSGARIPGATVEVDPGSRQTNLTLTDEGGEALVTGLPPGDHQVRVSVPGFERWEKKVRVKDGATRVEARMNLARVVEDVSVSPEAAAGSRGYKTTLTEADLESLPDDPDELEAALRAIAGPQAAFRVNGFSAGRLPPKSQIRRIRLIMNPYAPEFHEARPVHVDIETKPGLGSWSRTFRSGFRNDALNSRSPLAPSRVPDSYRRFGFDLSGPLAKDRTSLSLSLEGRMTDTARTVRAETPAGPLSRLADSGTDRLDVAFRVEHAWAKTHTLRGEVSSLSRNETGLGVGGFDLPSRGYAQEAQETAFSLVDNGVILGRVAAEVRVHGRFESLAFDPSDNAPTVLVKGAFNDGGAGISGRRSSRELGLVSNFDVSVGGKQAIRFGFDLRNLSVRSDEQRNRSGTFTFGTLADYEARRPSLFTQRSGDSEVRFTQQQIGVYVQDEARVTPRLTLSGGLRLERQSGVSGPVKTAPRASFTYGLGTKAAIRGGAGLFYDWYAPEIYEQTLRFNGKREIETLLSDPSWPDPGASALAESSRATRILQSEGLTLPRGLRTSLGYERTLASRLRLTGDYTYQRGSHELRSRNRSPVGSALSVREIESTARSARHSLDLRLNLMPSPDAKGGFFLGYMWQSARNESDGALSLPADENALSAEWGRSSSDVRHRVFGLVTFNPTKQISLGALIFAQSGAPFDITTGRDDNGDALFNDRPAGVTRNTGAAPARINVDLRLGWAKSFGGARPSRPGEGIRVIQLGGGEGVPGTSGRGDPQRYRVSVFVQAMNALNRTNPTQVGTVFGSPLFSRPVAADPGRRIELGMSVSF